MARRGHNEGSIYKRKDGRWVGQVQTGFRPDGKRKFAIYYGKTRNEVAEKISNTTSDISRNLYVEPSNIEVTEWIWSWLKNYKEKIVRPNTYARYISLTKCHIVPNLTKIKLKNLKTTHIQNIYNSCVDAGVSASALKHIHTVFNQSLDQAVREGLIFTNPAKNTVRPKPKKKEVSVLTVKQQIKLFDSLENNTMGVLIKLAICSGARMGELLALKWNDIDFKNKVMHIRNNLTPIFNFDEDGRDVHASGKVGLSELKTESSKRDIPLTNHIVDVLKDYKKHQSDFIKLIKKSDNVTYFTDMVFLNEAGGYMTASSVRKQYKKLLESLNIPYVKFHALRHTFATRILEANVHPKVAQELLRHSTCSITMDIYSHVLPDQKRDAINKIEGIM